MSKRKWIMIAVVLVALIVGIVIIMLIKSSPVESKAMGSVRQEEGSAIQVVARTDSEEEAKEIAELYGITYLRYRDGYGEYMTTQNYEDLKALGLKNNYPDLEILYKSFTK